MFAPTDSLLAWASEEFARPWTRLCQVAHRLSLGAELTPEEARVRVLFTPFEIDYAAVFPLVGALLRTVLYQPARLATIIHDGAGRVVRAYLEDTREGHYVSVHPLELPEPVPLEGPQLLELAKERAALQGLPRADWVKVADLRFFERFREAGTDPRKLFKAARTAVENGWIWFHPLPPAFRALFRWMDRLRRFDPDHLRIPEFPLPDLAVAVRGPDFTTVLHPRKLAVRFRHEGPFSELADRIVEQGISSRAIAVRAEWLLQSLRRWLERDRWDFYFLSEHLKAAGQFAKRLGQSWDVAPRPRGLSRFSVWLARWLFLPLDLDFVLRRGVAAVLREVVREKGESRLGLLVEEKGRTLVALEFRFRDGAVEEVRTDPPDQIGVDSHSHIGYNAPPTRRENGRGPVVVIHLEVVREWLRFQEASWKEKLAIAASRPVTIHPEALARRIPRRPRWWVWQVIRLPFVRR